MVRNYIKIALRSLWHNKVHSVINILGLSLGIMCCILIVLFVNDELTFDRFHKKADRIYRVFASEDWGVNQQFSYTETPFAMGPTLKENIPEVEKQVRYNFIGSQVKVDQNSFSEFIAIGGQDFFDVFDFDVVAGDLSSALRGQGQVVLVKSMARKYFGKTDPINKVISIQLGDKFVEFVVKAVIENVPVNSSLKFHILISDLNYPKLYR